MIKKWVTGTAGLVLLTGMLAGCGSSNSNGTDESASTNNGGAANKGAERG